MAALVNEVSFEKGIFF